MWIARDQDSSSHLFYTKPKRTGSFWFNVGYCHSEFAYSDNDVLKDNDGKEYTIYIGCDKLIIHNKSRIINSEKFI